LFGKSQKKLKREQELQKSGKHFAECFKTAQNIGSASASRSELVSESVSVEVVDRMKSKLCSDSNSENAQYFRTFPYWTLVQKVQQTCVTLKVK
jgi:hypothetical protein